jgi:hypothetical protein
MERRSTHLSLEAILANSNCRCCMADFSRWSKSLRAGAAIESMMICVMHVREQRRNVNAVGKKQLEKHERASEASYQNNTVLNHSLFSIQKLCNFLRRRHLVHQYACHDTLQIQRGGKSPRFAVSMRCHLNHATGGKCFLSVNVQNAAAETTVLSRNGGGQSEREHALRFTGARGSNLHEREMRPCHADRDDIVWLKSSRMGSGCRECKARWVKWRTYKFNDGTRWEGKKWMGGSKNIEGRWARACIVP